MKQSDIFTLVLIAGIGTLAAFFVCQTLLGDPSQASVKFKTVNRTVSADLVAPDPEIFNSMSINPTIEVYVGDCEDIDQNGILDDVELEICEQTKENAANKDDENQGEENGDDNQDQGEDQGQGENNTEGE